MIAIKHLAPEQKAEFQADVKAAHELGLDYGQYRIKKKLEKQGLAWTREGRRLTRWPDIPAEAQRARSAQPSAAMSACRPVAS
jgi:hypothetical protein